MSAGHRHTERRTCGSDEYHRQLIETDEEYRRANDRIEEFTERYVGRKAEEGETLREHIVTIPVVVHVVYNTSRQNISRAQIESQLDVLNEDFRANNTDVTRVPPQFEPIIADTRIEFELANRDPDCQPTDGITRTQTSVQEFGTNEVRSSATGGQDNWPPDEYLNIWVCPFRALGRATFPAMLATDPDNDGIVVDFEAFGTTGTASAPFDRGRTATHEVGHWLNLLHIWDRAGCGNDDNVGDTPEQDVQHYGCPTYPPDPSAPSSCGSTDMFMNYMDYVDDQCMQMFTVGQSNRMAAALFGPRSEIVGSDALQPPSGAADLWMQDTPADRGAEPNTASSSLYRSQDIWVRRMSDGFDHQQHQNPVYRSMGSSRNYVYVRVRCDGCSGSENGELKLYWAKASTGLSWPEPWDGSVTSPVLMGGPIGSKSTGSISAGDHEIFEFEWTTPDPADYAAAFGSDKGHFCLLARIETANSPPYGMAVPEGSNLSENVRNNNNIVWKNVEVTAQTSGGNRVGSVLVGGGGVEEDAEMRLAFEFTQETQFESLLRTGQIHVSLGDELYERWDENGFAGEGIEPVEGGFLVVRPTGYVGDFAVDPDGRWPVDVTYEPDQDHNRTELGFLDLIQQDVSEGTATTIGGQRFTIATLGEIEEPPSIEPRPFPIDPFEQWLEQMFTQSLGRIDVERMRRGMNGDRADGAIDREEIEPRETDRPEVDQPLVRPP